MKQIKLTKNKYAIVDDVYFGELNKFKWHCSFYGYAARRDGKKIIYMHCELLKTSEGLKVDHINQNTLDNRIENLRVCTHMQNLWNRDKSSNNTSGSKGVSWSKRKQKWVSNICKNYKQIYLGEFINKEDAVLAYNNKAKELFGEYAYLSSN